ncbi:MAG: hypothetical protein Fur0025_29930 [Oscillatoriaceae cyanobacterium]
MTETKPLVSIGMPVYNEARYLRQTIDAILDQDYQNFELIISDNASSDATPQICAEYATKDQRIRYYSHPTNVGATKNFNRVFELAIGDYFVWVAGHDIWQPTFLSACIAGLARDKSAVLCYPRAVTIDGNGKQLEIIPSAIDTQGLDAISRFHTVLWGLGYCYPIYGVIKASALRQTGLARNVVGPDNIILAELSTWGTFVCLPEPLLHLRRLDDFGSWDKYLEKVFNKSTAELSALDLFWQMIEAHLQVINSRFTKDIEKDAATISTVACLMTKYVWVLKGILESQARSGEIEGAALAQLKAQNSKNLNQLASHLNKSASICQKMFFPHSKNLDKTVKKIIIDGVFFQINNSGIARVWASLLREWAGSEFAQNILLLDRAGTAPRIPGIKYLCINPYNYNNTEADRGMLQQICDAEQADLFISTYYTTPITTPSVFLAYDMIPEIIKADLSAPMWQEKHQAIRHATAYISISENTAKDLVKCFPEISPDSVTVAHCGISSHFQPVNAAAIDQFKAKYHITKPYFVVVGDRAGLNGYKNTILFFQAFAQLPQSQETEIICVGGRPQLEPQLKASAPDAKVHLLTLNDSELAAAYSGAIALVYPSKYEGFGLPIIEAMACGCPVITTPNGAIPEAAGTAAVYIKDDDIPTLTTALINIQNPEVRQPLIAAGFAQAQKFSWAKMAATVRHALIQATNLPSQESRKTPAPEPAISPSQMPALQQADIANILQKYEQNPSDANTLAHIRQLRQQIAKAWLNTPSEHLDTAYNGELGKTHHALLDSGLKINHSITDIPISEAEQPLFQEISAKIARGFNHPLALQSILAAMLYRRAYKLPLQYQGAPIPKWFIKDFLDFLLDSPQYFQEIGETEKYYTYLHGLIEYLHQRILANPDAPIWQEISWLFAQNAFFLPLYFSSANLKDTYTKRSDIAEFALKNRGSQIDRQFPPRSPQRNKIRLGVLNLHFNPKTETFVTIPVIEHLNRDQFEIILYTIHANGNPLEQYCQRLADKFIKLPPDLNRQVQAMRDDDLDILFIGTNLTVGNAGLYLLPMHRLARLQVTSLSSPTTTGMPHIDCYIAGDLTAPTSFQDQYRERLVNLPGSGLCFHYPNQGLPTLQTPGAVAFPDRNSIGVAPEALVFVSGANFYKITPELRQTWAKIIAAVPNSVLLLYPFGPAWIRSYPQMAFIEQMQAVFAAYGIAPNRLKVLNTLPSRQEVKQVLQLADVYLDSYPYGGATSLLDPLEVGLPPIVLEGKALRFRQASALMRELQITDFIATGDESYIKLAIALGTNPQLRQQYRQQILAKMQANPAFLDSRTYGAKIGNLFQELFHQWQQGGNLSQLPSSPPLAGKMPAPRKEFINQLIGCANLHYIDPTDQPIIAELRQLRRELADFWLVVPPEQIPDFYNGDVGKAHQALIKSGFLAQPLTEEENSFLKPLLERLEAGGNAPSTLNYSRAVELYLAGS